jgi:hypothetical protein
MKSLGRRKLKALVRRLVHKLLLKWVDIAFIQEHFLHAETDIQPGDLICPAMNDNLLFEAVGILYQKDLSPILVFKDVNGPNTVSAKLFEYKRAPLSKMYNKDFPVF